MESNGKVAVNIIIITILDNCIIIVRLKAK